MTLPTAALQRWWPFLLFSSIVFAASIGVTIWYFSHNTDSGLITEQPPNVLGQVSAAEPDVPKDLTTLTILLLGYGGPGHQGGYLSDVLQLIHIDLKAAKITAISIPRDLWVELPNGTAGKINSALTQGDDSNDPVGSGGPIAAAMAEVVTGLEVKYFSAIDFVGFERLVGQTLDGLEVTVTEPFEDAWYPVRGKEQEPCGFTPQEIADLTNTYSGFDLEKQFPCRYEKLKFTAGTMPMEGGDALKYVRSRHGSSGGDFSRSRRQHDVLLAIRDRLFSLQTLTDVPKYYTAITKHVQTNLDLEAAEYIAPAVRSADKFTTQAVVLSTDNMLQNGRSSSGQYILSPKAGANQWSETHTYIQSQLAKQ